MQRESKKWSGDGGERLKERETEQKMRRAGGDETKRSA